jgi:hypothetical protein
MSPNMPKRDYRTVRGNRTKRNEMAGNAVKHERKEEGKADQRANPSALANVP